MKVEQLEDITIDQQQAVFGAYDTLIAIVERALMVTIGLHNSVAVSYTHLDVYKRQVQPRSLKICSS